MSVTDRVWAALTAMIRLEDKVIRLEAQLDLLTSAAMGRRIRGEGT